MVSVELSLPGTAPPLPRHLVAAVHSALLAVVGTCNFVGVSLVFVLSLELPFAALESLDLQGDVIKICKTKYMQDLKKHSFNKIPVLMNVYKLFFLKGLFFYIQ